MKCKAGYMSIAKLLLVVIACVALLAPAANAQDEAIKERITPVVSPDATCMAVDESLGLLIVGQRGEKGLSIYKLDDKGLPQGEPKQVVLPTDAKLKGLEMFPTSVVTHPTLPLIYVRHDAAIASKIKHRYRANAHANLDHLYIFELAADGSAKERGVLARGPEFDYGFSVGDLSITPDGGRIYLPHMDSGGKEATSIGYYDLQEDGMPQPVPVPIEGTLDGMGLSKFEMKVQPRLLNIHSFVGNDHPSYSVLGVNERVAMFSVNHGLGMWDTVDRRGEIGVVTVPGTAVHNRMGAQGVWPPIGTTDRPGVPAVYMVGQGSGAAIRFRHAYGFPTMMHQRMTYSGGNFQSQPVVVGTDPAWLVAGGLKCIHVMPLDKTGDLATGHAHIAVENPKVAAIAYSQKYDKLYVPVTKIEEAK